MSEANFFFKLVLFLTSEAGKAVVAALVAIMDFFKKDEQKSLPNPTNKSGK
jgi:hypothetical protein